MPSIAGLRVIRSSIHGYGVIATRDFRADEVITEVDGILVDTEEPLDDRYVVWLVDDWYLDMLDQTRWINHSCEPNVWVDGGVREDGQPWAHVVALRDIRAGEELSYDYAFPAQFAERCFCGASQCRGWIVDPDELERAKAAAGNGSSGNVAGS
ncbi:MAG: SET domain-containing protein-lysine N-methyltransferase [bacterium]